MSVVKVYIPTPFRDLTGGLGHVQGDGATIGELIADLERRYPGLANRICEGGTVRLHVNVFVNGQEMRCLSGEATSLNAGDEIAFIPALVGGCRAVSKRRADDFSGIDFDRLRTRTS
jgi:molybdopterin synthase sulfur carrier subunit